MWRYCDCVGNRNTLMSCLRNSTRPLRWRHNGRDSVSNHQPHDCLLNRLFRRRSKKTSKLRATGLCVGNSPGTGEFPAQMASNAENVSIWWRHHAFNDFWSETSQILTQRKTSSKHFINNSFFLLNHLHIWRVIGSMYLCVTKSKSNQMVEVLRSTAKPITITLM